MFPQISALSSLNFYDLRAASPSNNNASNEFMKQAVAAATFTPNHPRHADSEGVSGVSPLSIKLDFLA